MKYLTHLLLPMIIFNSCQKNPNANTKKSDHHHTDYTILFQRGDTVWVNDSIYTSAKGNHDLISYLPINNSNEHGYLFVSHETMTIDSILGNGGGATIFEIEKQENKWQVKGRKKAIDFSEVGETVNNCGGKLTSKGTILMAEEICPTEKMHHPFFEKAKIDDLTNFGWIVEVNPSEGKALHKCFAMGRFIHEDALSLPDGKTVFLTNDASPAVFFKFIADTPHDYTKGKLFAYNQHDSTNPWIELPQEKDSLVNTKKIAFRKGATLFCRHEWMTMVDGKIYITETGFDHINWKKAIDLGAVPARHYSSYLKQNKYEYDDPYGRVLVFDPIKNTMEVYLEGNEKFSNPDCITSFSKKGKDYLVVAEDIIGIDRGRSLENEWGNQLWALDLAIKDPNVEDLQLLFKAPRGSEITGNQVTPDGQSLFLNIQHPLTTNEPPFNRSTTIVMQTP